MTLLEYLTQHRMSQVQFAAESGIEVSVVNRAVHGRVMPSPRTMQAIYKATNGAVTANDFHDGMAA